MSWNIRDISFFKIHSFISLLNCFFLSCLFASKAGSVELGYWQTESVNKNITEKFEERIKNAIKFKERISKAEELTNLLQERKQIIINEVVTGKIKI